MKATTERSDLFGHSCIRNCKISKRLYLVDILPMRGSKLSAVMAILDCSGHMVGEGKKDAEFIMSFSNPRLMSLMKEKY